MTFTISAEHARCEIIAIVEQHVLFNHWNELEDNGGKGICISNRAFAVGDTSYRSMRVFGRTLASLLSLLMCINQLSPLSF